MDETCLWIGRIVVLGSALFTVALLLVIIARKMGGRDNLGDYMSIKDIAESHPNLVKCPMCEGTLDTLRSGALYCKHCNPKAPAREREFYEMMERHAEEEVNIWKETSRG